MRVFGGVSLMLAIALALTATQVPSNPETECLGRVRGRVNHSYPAQRKIVVG